ncbi:MAG: aspartyl-phosphate phosphatase Spo0E family protein [Bacillota bacterium]|nr:aspartyl-phosphate phosphatase Spo0E family protein [Bacillota bacterium]
MKLTVCEQICEQIEDLRLQMQRIASDKALTDPSVVRASEKLDILINNFYLDRIRKIGA